MRKKLTITIDEQVYEGLYALVGPRRISQFIEDLVRPLVLTPDLDIAALQSALAEAREKQAQAWVENVAGDVDEELS